MRPVVVIGKCRSGTSAFSETCHWLGYMMAGDLGYPVPGVGRPEWEDSQMTVAMALEFPALSESGREERFVSYIESRIDMLGLYGTRRIGFKSPLLSLYLDPFIRALAACGLKPPLVVRSVRNSQAIEESIDRQPHFVQGNLRKWNREIEVAKPHGWIVDIPYRDLLELPEGTVSQLAILLDVNEPILIARAAANVRQPL